MIQTLGMKSCIVYYRISHLLLIISFICLFFFCALIKTSVTDFSSPVRARIFIVSIHLKGGQVCWVDESHYSYIKCCFFLIVSLFLSPTHMEFCQGFIRNYIIRALKFLNVYDD